MKMFIVEGASNVGKTTFIKEMVKVFQKQDYIVVGASPTNDSLDYLFTEYIEKMVKGSSEYRECIRLIEKTKQLRQSLVTHLNQLEKLSTNGIIKNKQSIITNFIKVSTILERYFNQKVVFIVDRYVASTLVYNGEPIEIISNNLFNKHNSQARDTTIGPIIKAFRLAADITNVLVTRSTPIQVNAELEKFDSHFDKESNEKHIEFQSKFDKLINGISVNVHVPYFHYVNDGEIDEMKEFIEGYLQ